MTVASIYIPPSAQQCQNELIALLDRLPTPVLLLGDFNAHHPAWGSSTTNTLGRFIAEKTLDKKLIILNDGSHTRIDPATGSSSVIDLSICSEMLASKLDWRTLSDTHSSDHFPIIVSSRDRFDSVTKPRRWMYDQADWGQYERLTADSIKPGEELEAEEFVDRILSAATASIPRTSGKVGPRSVPWWCPEVKMAIKQRRKWLRALKRKKEAGSDTADVLKKFQEAKAAAKKVVKDAKDRTWEEFVGKISPTSTAAEMWQTVNTLRGKRQHRTPIIKKLDGYTNEPEEVAEELANHYFERSATSSYPPLFQRVKDKAERNCIDPLPDTNNVYNSDFSLNELLWALDKGRSASTGPDSVGYPMLRRLPLSAKKALLELFNRVWQSGDFPASWRTGIIVPIPKPNSSDSGPASFRPITLTNCIAKVFERLVNRRLITELEENERLDKRQHAFRAGRGVDTYLAELDKSLPNRDEHCLIASLDLSKAYDTTWRFGILRTLRKWQIGGRMFNMVKSFLAERSFRVNVGGHLSREMPLENGVPQGSVLSVTLFLVAMQPIFKVVPSTVTVLLYADDILLVVRRNKNQPLHRVLQIAVKAVDKWAKKVGFKISAAKSYIFYGSSNARREPSKNICIDKIAIPKTSRLKIVGITLDRTLTFKPHCKIVKTACDSRLRIIKMISARIPRGQRDSLLRVGSAIITSRLFYGIGLVSRAEESVIQTLAPIYNRMVRYASGAYVTSPITAIMAEAGTLPFDLLFLQALVRTAARMMEKNQGNVNLPVVQRASDRLSELVGVQLPSIAVRIRSTNRMWHDTRPNIVWDIKRKVKAGDPPQVVRPMVQELLSNRFKHATVVYTDGSKCGNKVGAGVFSRTVQRSVGLPSQCGVFSAEAFAIKSALSDSTPNQLLLLSDSASCLSAIETGKSQHPWIQEIEDMLQNRRIHLCWIPGHAGIRGNEEADRLAGEARDSTPLNVAVPRKDAIKAMSQSIRQHWEERWRELRDVKLQEVKGDTKKWFDQKSPADQRVLTRLRIGHTRLTHEFLLNKSPPPICDCCGTVMDVRHIILHCRKFDESRMKHKIDPTSLQMALCNVDDNEKRLLEFLREIDIYRKL